MLYVKSIFTVYLHIAFNPSFICSFQKSQRGKAETTEAAAGGKIAADPGKIAGSRKKNGECSNP